MMVRREDKGAFAVLLIVMAGFVTGLVVLFYIIATDL